MAKRIKLQNKNGETIEVWDYQVEEMTQQGWSDQSAKPKKKSTTKSFNTEEGVETLIHEFRHKAIDDDPVLRKIVDDSPFPEELIVRAMDVKYFDKERAKEYVERFNLTEYGQEQLAKTINELEEASVPKKEEKEEPSFFSMINEKLGFNQGGIANINYLTRKL